MRNKLESTRELLKKREQASLQKIRSQQEQVTSSAGKLLKQILVTTGIVTLTIVSLGAMLRGGKKTNKNQFNRASLHKETNLKSRATTENKEKLTSSIFKKLITQYLPDLLMKLISNRVTNRK